MGKLLLRFYDPDLGVGRVGFAQPDVDADQVIYLDHGRATGTGTHARLLATHPGYTQLYRLHHPLTPDPVAT